MLEIQMAGCGVESRKYYVDDQKVGSLEDRWVIHWDGCQDLTRITRGTR